MSDPTKGWKVRVDPLITDEPKFISLARAIKPDIHKIDRLEEIVALGLLVRLWCATMKKEDTGTLHGWAPEEIAIRCGWIGDVTPERFINALLNCGKTSTRKDGPGFLVQPGPDYEVYRWADWQNDPAGQRKEWRERSAAKTKAKKNAKPPISTPSPSGDDTVVKTMLQLMDECGVRGTPLQKRDAIKSWRISGNIERAQSVIGKDGKGKDIFWVSKAVDGPSAADKRTKESTDSIRDTFMKATEKLK
jgi:hypothetical protein